MAPILKQADAFAKKMDMDIIAYLGEIRAGYDDALIELCRNHKPRKNVLLILITQGGDLNVAYRISRALQERYNTYRLDHKKNVSEKKDNQGNFAVLIDSHCKSAGALLCLGADTIYMSESGLLGPIDVELRKYEDRNDENSPPTSIQAMQFLETQSTLLYRRHYLALRYNNAFSTEMASQIATDLTSELLTPLYEQINPTELAEIDRSLKVAKEYGERLQNGNLNDTTLSDLLTAYPSPDFVIDRKEAKKLFKVVEDVPPELKNIAKHFFKMYTQLSKKNKVFCAFVSSPRK